MKKIILAALMAFCTQIIFAQSILEDQFQFNYSVLNPALMGANENFSLNAGMGSQFNGSIRPQPIYQLFSIDGLLGKNGNHGVGLQAYNGNNSGEKGAKISYAYRYRVGDLFTIAAGLSGGVVYQSVISNSGSIGQVLSYTGGGALLTANKFFVSISKPVAFTKNESFLGIRKPFYTMGGYSFGDYYNTMFNVSFLYEKNESAPTNYYLTGKFWLGRKLGLGLSYRSQNIFGTREKKIVPMAEYHFSSPFRLSLAYDPKPYRFYQASNQAYEQRGVLLIFIRYDFMKDNEDTEYRMRYY
jgi:type IX secretion system PorP/SprF family membrane protein